MSNNWLQVFLRKLIKVTEACDNLSLEVDFTNIEEYPTLNRVDARIIFHHEKEEETKQ